MRERFSTALKESMRARNERAVSTIRLMMAALKDREIAARGRGEDGVSEAEILGMLQTMVKQRREAIDLYEKGGRCELAEQEREEIAIIEDFLPKALSDEETRAAIASVVAELGADSLKQMGAVMAELRNRYPGQMDFGKASALVKDQLGAVKAVAAG